MNSEEEIPNEIILYIGTHKIVGLEVSLQSSDPRVLRYVVQKDPEGFEKGLVTHLQKSSATLISLLSQLAEKGKPLRENLSCYVVLGNSKLRSYGYSSSVYYQGMQRSITSQEMRQVISQTRSVATLPLTEFVLQAIPESYVVNDTEAIKNPIGLEAHRLGVNLKIHTMNFQDFKNISRAFESAEIEVQAFFPKSVAVSEAVLTDQEKTEGALLIDIADESTSLSLWKEGAFIDTRVIACGGSAFSSKIAADWSIELRDARKLKEKYGSLEPHAMFGDELIPIVERKSDGHHQVRRQEFQEKLFQQAQEWLSSILTQADLFAQEHKVLHPHYIYTGGGSSIQGFLEFLHKNFSRSGRIGLARQVDAPNELLVDASISAALGMVRWLATYEREQKQHFAPKGFLQKTLASAKGWFTAYF